MADEVASLGFAVDSAPLDAAKQKLADVATQSDKTGKSVDDLNQSLSKTADSASKSGTGLGTITPALSAIDSAAKRAGVSVAEMQARTAAFSTDTGKLASAVGAANIALNAHATSVKGAADAHDRLSTQSQAAFHSVRSLTESLISGASPIQAFTQQLNHLSFAASGPGGITEAFAGVARMIGPTGLFVGGIAAITGIAAALESVNDAVERTKQRFAGLTGSVEGGAKAYDAVKAAAKSAGIESDVMASAFEKASMGQAEFADKNVIYANTAENAAKQSEKLAQSLGTVGQMMQANSDTAAQEKAELDALASSFQKNGALTVDAFKKIQEQSPATALSISRAFGYDKVTEFIKELGRAPITIEDFIERMSRIKPQVDALFDPEKPKNFSQAMREIKEATEELAQSLAKAGATDFVKNLISGTAKDIDALAHPLDAAGKAFEDFAKRAETSWSDIVKISDDDGALFGKSITVDIDTAVSKVLATLGRLPSDGLTSITAWANGAIGKFSDVANAAVQSASKAVSALSKIGSGGGGSQMTGNTDAMGNAISGSVDGAGNQIGDVGLSQDAVDYAQSVADGTLPAFADGGQLTVTGSGGTDSQLIQFKATPGETVTVSTPSQNAAQSAGTASSSGGISGLTTIQGKPAVAGVVSTTPDPASQASVSEITDAIDKSAVDIAKQIAASNQTIVDELAKLTGGVAASTVNPSTGLKVAGSNGNFLANLTNINGFPVPNFSGGASGGSGGGGGFQVKGGDGEFGSPWGLNDIKSANQGTVSGPYFGNPAYGGSTFAGRSVPIGRTSGASSFQSRSALNPAMQSNYGGYSPLNSGMFDYLNGGGLSDYYGYDTGYGSVGSQTTSGYNDYGYSSYAGYDTGAGSPSNYGSSVYDSASGYMNSGGAGYTSGSFDTPYYGEGGGGDFSMGYATGGSFLVGGDGGTDTTPISFMATKGERVTITPGSVAKPTMAASISPDPAANSDNINPQASGGMTTTKIVNMFLHSSVQANDILKSRAQIARGM